MSWIEEVEGPEAEPANSSFEAVAGSITHTRIEINVWGGITKGERGEDVGDASKYQV